MTIMDLQARIRSHYESRVRASAPTLERKLRAAAPVVSGRMRDRTTVTPSRPLHLTVTVDTPYATYTTEGTEPHEIAATRAGALRFFWDRVGPPQPRFYRRVWHPGTQPNPWYKKVIDDWGRILTEQQVE
jgi:hypothetical protein